MHRLAHWIGIVKFDITVGAQTCWLDWISRVFPGPYFKRQSQCQKVKREKSRRFIERRDEKYAKPSSFPRFWPWRFSVSINPLKCFQLWAPTPLSYTMANDSNKIWQTFNVNSIELSSLLIIPYANKINNHTKWSTLHEMHDFSSLLIIPYASKVSNHTKWSTLHENAAPQPMRSWNFFSSNCPVERNFLTHFSEPSFIPVERCFWCPLLIIRRGAWQPDGGVVRWA